MCACLRFILYLINDEYLKERLLCCCCCTLPNWIKPISCCCLFAFKFLFKSQVWLVNNHLPFFLTFCKCLSIFKRLVVKKWLMNLNSLLYFKGEKWEDVKLHWHLIIHLWNTHFSYSNWLVVSLFALMYAWWINMHLGSQSQIFISLNFLMRVLAGIENFAWFLIFWDGYSVYSYIILIDLWDDLK